MRALSCLLGHDRPGNRCRCRRCGARNEHGTHAPDERCVCTVCGAISHAFGPAGEARHRCSRCGHEEAHALIRLHRWVDVGAWDSTFGPYEVEQEFEQCARCGFGRPTGPPDFDRRR